jgi:glyoxylase-like metal-dependent hydrolase (beta-lactamase superfamily II)
MRSYICTTCGVQFAATEAPPDHCPVCADERQYIGMRGQVWTTLEDLRSGHHNLIQDEEPMLTGIGTVPSFAIGQRALLVQTLEGNVLWDCVSLIDDATVEAIRLRGGLRAIAISHPHFYSSMVEYSQAFDGAPIYLHADDCDWVMHPDPAITFWEGETQPLCNGLTLIRCGGHFPGGTILYWTAGAGGRGTLLTGDVLTVTADRRHVSFMYSYPNYIPLAAPAIRQIVRAVEPFDYDSIYGGWFDRVIATDAKSAVSRSAERYLRAIGAEDFRMNKSGL